MPRPQRCIGVIGGMGPSAGIFFQRLLFEATSATCDQEHLPVICFTNPNIPDRTTSLLQDGGEAYVATVIQTGEALIRAGATVLVMTCNTAHARFSDIQAALSVPLMNLVDLAATAAAHRSMDPVGILGTDGLVTSGTYQDALHFRSLVSIIPTPQHQKRTMQLIYQIKARDISRKAAQKELAFLITALRKNGARQCIIACTELSECANGMLSPLPLIEPLHLAAQYLVYQMNMN